MLQNLAWKLILCICKSGSAAIYSALSLSVDTRKGGSSLTSACRKLHVPLSCHYWDGFAAVGCISDKTRWGNAAYLPLDAQKLSVVDGMSFLILRVSIIMSMSLVPIALSGSAQC